ncbi:MAG: mannonate dehydratase [Terriglobia bacterium]
MKLGLGLYRHMLNAENYHFARQCGCTHVIVHLVDYFNEGENNDRQNQPVGGKMGWGRAGDPQKLWSEEELTTLRQQINATGLELLAIENLDPAHWYDVLLDGPKKLEHLENVKTIIRRMGRAGIPVLGYNFSLAGVAGRIKGPFARGGAVSAGMDEADQTPIPNGTVWNMVYDPDAPPGVVPAATSEQLWQRLSDFLEAVIPVAEESGVTLAAHPDDPPVPLLRGQPRLVYQPRLYQKLLDLKPSLRNQLEFCVGSLAEMTEGDIYDVVEQYSRQRKLAYVHLRNVQGKAPHYREKFIDEGDIDAFRVLEILKRNQFEGVIIPDHTPQMDCTAPWHAGMAYALGYFRASLQRLAAQQ